MFVGIMMALTLSFGLPLIKNVALRKIYSTTFGIFMSFYTFGSTAVVLIPYNMIGYFAMVFLPRQYAIIAIVVISGGILTIENYRMMMIEELGFKVKCIMMITFCKMHMLSCNYRDGAGDINTGLNSREKARAIKTLPSLVDYICYMFNLGSGVCGPCFEYKEWDDFINLRGHYSKMRIGSNVRPALLRAFHGLLISQVSPAI